MHSIKPDQRTVEQLYMKQPFKLMDCGKQERTKRKQAGLAIDIGLLSGRDDSSASKQMSKFSETTSHQLHESRVARKKFHGVSVDSDRQLTERSGISTQLWKREAVDENLNYLLRMMNP